MVVLTRLSKAGITLGLEKCECQVFFGQLVDKDGVKPDPNKVRAIQQMKPPSTVSELRQFLRTVNQQSKLSPHLADRTKPLQDFLSLKNQWRWRHEQQQAFDNRKRALNTSEVLALYDARHEAILSADAQDVHRECSLKWNKDTHK